MSGERIFITTGKPKRAAAATASSAVAQAASGADTIPAFGEQPLRLGFRRGCSRQRHGWNDRWRCAGFGGKCLPVTTHRLDRNDRSGRILMHDPAIGFELVTPFRWHNDGQRVQAAGILGAHKVQLLTCRRASGGRRRTC